MPSRKNPLFHQPPLISIKVISTPPSSPSGLGEEEGGIEMTFMDIKASPLGLGGEEGGVEMTFMEIKGGRWKSGLILEGIQIRPAWK
ncbi:hypothetical protein MRB53_032622 [Persea americana]|uniref:Uncharacterized protein n=2 Tax=Persea americana TaxID=3435 RepID=A0ACC2KSD2_PERAE|nr:hypothetical protein MRB53_032620 [Persea americana]KAJ8624092.1 hypothetical protein MRB53_032622 [Persea americana]